MPRDSEPSRCLRAQRPESLLPVGVGSSVLTFSEAALPGFPSGGILNASFQGLGNCIPWWGVHIFVVTGQGMPESFGEKGRPLFLWDLFLGEIPQPLFFLKSQDA